MGYPQHEKKVKHIIFKFSGDVNDIYVDAYSDGYVSNSSGIELLDKYNSIDITSAKFDISKKRLPSKCRNFAIKMIVRETQEFYLQSVGYIFKLGKMRDF